MVLRETENCILRWDERMVCFLQETERLRVTVDLNK